MFRLQTITPFAVGLGLLYLLLGLVSQVEPVSAVPTTTYNIPPADAERIPFDRDDGVCTLAEAVEAANDQGNTPNLNDCPAGSVGTNIIQLQAGTYSLTQSDFFQNGNLAAPGIDFPLEIRGVTSATTIIERDAGAPEQFRFFLVDDGSLVLEDVTLTNGYISGDNTGGAIRVNSGGVLSMTGVTLSNNTALEGGALYAGGITFISASSIVGNNATANDNGRGGGIYVANQMLLINSNVTANLSTEHGGGLYIVNTGSGQAIVALSSLSQNVANTDADGAGAGGGIYHNSGNLSVTLSTLDMNVATPDPINGNDGDGGGLFVASTMEMDFTLVSANAANNGAGLYNDAPANSEIRRSLFIANIAADDGGGIYNQGDVLLDNGILWANIATLGNGGGIANDANSGRRADLRNSTIVQNMAPAGSGGGMYNLGPDTSATAAVSNVTIASNQAGGGDGGGIANGNTGYIVVANATIYNNTASGNGAGIASTDPISDHFFIRNTILGNNDCSGNYTSQGHNLDSGASCSFAALGDINNGTLDLGTLSPADPLLVLTGNITPGYEPQANSDALNAGNEDGCFDALNINNNGILLTEDQWGQARPLGGAGFHCDIGAVENQAVLAVALLGQEARPSVWPVWGVGVAAVLLLLATAGIATRRPRFF